MNVPRLVPRSWADMLAGSFAPLEGYGYGPVRQRRPSPSLQATLWDFGLLCQALRLI